MAFPVVEATNTSSEASATTNHTVSLPASIASGDLLVVGFAARQTFITPIPTGWTQSKTIVHGSSVDIRFRILTRTADGGEGATLSVTTNDSRQSAHFSYRISGWGSFEFSTGVEGTTGDPDPDSLTPSGGSDDYLWLAMCQSMPNRTVTVAPTNYSALLSASSGTAAESANVGAAQRSLAASSEDPGAFDLNEAPSGEWGALTMAVFPAGAAAPNAPTGVTASNPTASTVDLNWTDTNSASAFPRLYRRTPAGSGDFDFVEQLADASATSYTFTGLASATEYDFGVSYSDS